MLDGFMADLAARTDSVTGEPLSDDVVITIEGDTPKTPLVNNDVARCDAADVRTGCTSSAAAR